MNIVIRKAIIEEIPLLKPLGIELQDNERSLYPDRASGAMIADKYNEILCRDVTSGEWQVFVAIVEGAIVGYVSGTANDSEDDLENITPGYYVGDLVVSQEYRSKGIGSQLLAAVYAYAKENGFCTVELGVLARNTAAQQFYRKEGFEDYEVVLRKRL